MYKMIMYHNKLSSINKEKFKSDIILINNNYYYLCSYNTYNNT